MNAQTDNADVIAAEAAGNEAAQEAAKAEAEAAFASGFDNVRGRDDTATNDDLDVSTSRDGTDGTTPAPGTDGTTPAAASTEVAAPDGPITEARALELFQSALDQEKARFDAEIRKINGKYGNLNGRIEELAKRKVLTKEDLAALKGEYEDIADLLGTNLPDNIEPLTPLDDTDDPTPPTVNEGAATDDTELAEVQAEADRILEDLSPGWAQKVASNEFAVWLGTFPATEREAIANSEDPQHVADKIVLFDAWKTSIDKRAATERNKRARLAGAEIPTRGNSPGSPGTEDENAAFEAGFSQVKGRR